MIPEQEPNRIIKGFVEAGGPKDWEHTQRLQWLYAMHDVVTTTWFSPQDESQLVLPQAVLAIDKMNLHTLAAFRLTSNPNGLPNEIILNEVWINRPEWELMESLTHETIHLYQEHHAKEKQPGFYTCANTGHNKQFVEIAEEIGLHPKLGEGYHVKPADGQFERLMDLVGIEKPEYAKKIPPAGDTPKGYYWDGARGKPKGTSTLTKYTATECPKERPCNFRAGKHDLKVRCVDCNSPFSAQP